jgi:putative hydrolase of the HAD superfamily
VIKGVIFDLDDTLYDTTLQVSLARRNAVKAMIAAGLDATEDEAEEALGKVVSEKGSNYQCHYDEMLSRMGAVPNPKVVAAGIVAYHETKRMHLTPYPDTMPTLLSLRDNGYRLAVVTDGLNVKQWEKLIRLGLSDLFHTVVIAGQDIQPKPSPQPFIAAANQFNLRPEECIVVGDRPDKDIAGAKRAGMASVQLVRGEHAPRKPSGKDEEPDYIIGSLPELKALLKSIR